MSKTQESDPTNEMSETNKLSGDVAIIGMAGRFPGAKNPEEFWRNLAQGVESIRFLSDEELLAAGVTRREFEDPNYVRACPVLEDVKKFDAAFFGMSPREASVMDPGHRFFLELTWEALENSGNTGLHEEGTVGVFAGAGGPTYLMNNVRLNDKIMAEIGEFLARHTGNDMNFLATRASYEMDLRGPSLNVQTACSSALVALHQARLSLLQGECDIALAGGSTINVPLGRGYHYNEGEILSPDGHCRPFDHRSAGTVFGNGAGCIVVKRLEDALDNGDTILAVVKGSAVNNDGALKVGYLAPGVERQVDVIECALDSGKIEADSISYVETHGTGTSVGDPIELTALAEAFSKRSDRKQFCGVGSVKSNIGHLGEAAAAASLIKVIQSFKYKALAPTLGFERPNPRFDLEDSPLYVVDRLTPWKSEQPLRAGITALGAGGTNCHVILEEPPAPLKGEGGRDAQLIVLSAKTRTALDQICLNLADALERDPALDLADVAYTLALGRRALPIRRVLAVRPHDAISTLRDFESTRMTTINSSAEEPRLAFSFPGGGAQYAGMAADLYREEPLFREIVDECFETIDELFDFDLRTLLFAPAESKKEATKKLERPSLSLPALFTVEYALARLFESWGLIPEAYVGHSMGEYVAACLAGVVSVKDAIRLVVTRGRLFETTAPGGMLALSVSESEARRIMPEGLSIAAVNAPELCVVSGPRKLLDSFKEKLSSDDEIDFTPIHIDVAAHSSMLESILAEFRAFCRTIEFKPPQKRLTSNLSGTWLTAKQATDPEYWVQHLRNTVRFSDCVETVLQDGPYVFLEIGPGRTLTSLARAQKTPVVQAFNSIRHFKEDANDLDFSLATLGKIWASGVRIDWSALYEEQLRNRVPLPTYPFEGREFWVEPSLRKSSESGELTKKDDIKDWFYASNWNPCPSYSLEEVPKNWLILSDQSECAEIVSRELRQLGAEVTTTVEFGSRLQRDRRGPGSLIQQIWLTSLRFWKYWNATASYQIRSSFSLDLSLHGRIRSGSRAPL
jgi:acyl transferase domain-containing protein